MVGGGGVDILDLGLICDHLYFVRLFPMAQLYIALHTPYDVRYLAPVLIGCRFALLCNPMLYRLHCCLQAVVAQPDPVERRPRCSWLRA